MTHDTGHKRRTQEAEPDLQGTGHRIHDSIHGTLDTGHKTQDADQKHVI